MAVSCYSYVGLSPEELKKAKANIASKKSKAKKAMQPTIDEIKAIDPQGLGKTAEKVLDDLVNNVIPPDEFTKTVNKLHDAAKHNQAAQAVQTAQAQADILAQQTAKAKAAAPDPLQSYGPAKTAKTSDFFDGFKPDVEVYTGEPYMTVGGPLDFLPKGKKKLWPGGPTAGEKMYIDWNNGDIAYPKTVDLNKTKLVSAQPEVTLSQVKHYIDNPGTGEMPMAFKLNDELWIVDGNHKLAAAKATGKHTAQINILDVDQIIADQGLPKQKLWPTKGTNTPTLDAKAKANLASAKSKAKKKATEQAQALHGIGKIDEAVVLESAIDDMANGLITPADLNKLTNDMKAGTWLPAPPKIPPASPAPIPTPTAGIDPKWQSQWQADLKKGGQLEAKNYPWAKDDFMKANPKKGYSPWVQEHGANFPGMSKGQAQVVKAAQNHQLQFPVVDVTLANAEFVPTQVGGLVDIVNKYVKNMPNDKFPRAYVWKGQYHLTNGHHRIMAAHIRGDALATVQVIDLDQLAGKDLWPGDLQALVDSLLPPPSAVPSSKISKSAQAKFGTKPTPAQASPTAQAIPSSQQFPNPPSITPGVVNVPPVVQAGTAHVKNILAQAHPGFASAEAAKKAAKKAANDKFYAKKKVEAALDQANAVGNPALVADLQVLYDDIVAGKIVTNAKDVLPTIDGIKAKHLAPKPKTPPAQPAKPQFTPTEQATLTEAQALADELGQLNSPGGYDLQVILNDVKDGKLTFNDLMKAVNNAEAEKANFVFDLDVQIGSAVQKSKDVGSAVHQQMAIQLQSDLVKGNIPVTAAQKALNDILAQVNPMPYAAPKSAGALASAKSLGKKKVQQEAAKATDPALKSALDHLAYQIQQGEIVLYAGSDANALISQIKKNLPTAAPAKVATPTLPTNAELGKWSDEFDTSLMDAASELSKVGSTMSAQTFIGYSDQLGQISYDLQVGLISKADALTQIDKIYDKSQEMMKLLKNPPMVVFPAKLTGMGPSPTTIVPPATAVPTPAPSVVPPVAPKPAKPKTPPVPDKYTAMDWAVNVETEIDALIAMQASPSFKLKQIQIEWGALTTKFVNSTMDPKDFFPKANAILDQLHHAPEGYASNIPAKLWDSTPIPVAAQPVSLQVGPYVELPPAGDMVTIIQGLPASGMVSATPLIPSGADISAIKKSLQSWQTSDLTDLLSAPGSLPTTKLKLPAKFRTSQGQFDASLLKKAAGGDLKTGRPVLIKSGDEYIIVSGGETIAGRLAAGIDNVDARIINLDDIKARPKPPDAPDYWAVPEQPNAPYQSEGYSAAEEKIADSWLIDTGQRRGTSGWSGETTKAREIIKEMKKDPRYAAAAQKAGLSDSEVEALIRNAISDWNGNSSRSAQMVAFHMAAADEFGLDPSSFRLTPNFMKTRPAAERLLKKNKDIYQVILRGMYETTQAEFRRQGITHVSLHRGYGFKANSPHMPAEFHNYLIGDKFAYTNQALPLQSWASVSGTARSFGSGKDWGYLTRTRVPVEQIVATGVTGFGTGTAEKEFILLSGPGTVWHEVLNRPDKKRRKKP